jgi:LPXTG-site transpeptidase (sortase) family protein
MVLEGDGADVLQKAVGHVPSTATPGGAGNVVVAGHRDTFFRALRKIRQDDVITFTTTQGVYNYQVRSIAEVGPQDVQVLKASDHPTLTLITCYPFDYLGPAPERFVVQAREAQSSEIGGPNYSLASARSTLEAHSRVRSTSSTRLRKAQINLYRPPSDSPPARIATALAMSAPVEDSSELAQETDEVQQDDPPLESLPKSHKRFGKIRAWLGSIPSHLH